MISVLMKKARSKLKTAKLAFCAGQYGDSVSRAYYAVFNAISALLYKKELVFSSHKHDQVIGTFNREFIQTGIFPSEIMRQISELFQDRQSSDYDPAPEISHKTAETHFNNAEAIINQIQSLIDNGTV